MKKLYRIQEGRKLAGVCGGIAAYFGIDSTVVRLAWVILVACFGTGILAYLLAMLVMPNDTVKF